MANGADEDWGWKVDLKSYLRWLIYDTIFGWLRERWQKVTMGELIAAGVAIYAYARNHPQLLLFALGAAAVLGLQLIEIGLRKVLFSPEKATPRAAEVDRPNPPSEIGRPETPREEIRFDYLPDSPISHGWRAEWTKHPIPSDAIWRAGADGSLLMELSDIYCPIDYRVSRRAALSTQLVCDLRFSDSTLFFVLFNLVTRDQSRNKEGPIKFELGRKQPYYTKEYDEWVLPIDPKPLGDGWYHLDISLADSVNQTWGQVGWTLSELSKIRLRGHIGISPIKLY